MIHQKTVKRLTCLTAILASGVVFVAAADLAHAKGRHHQDNKTDQHFAKSFGKSVHKSATKTASKKAAKTHVVNTIHPIIVTGKNGDHKSKQAKGESKAQFATKNCKTCVKPTQTGMLPPHDPVGNTHPAAPPSKTAGGNTVTVSNGVSKVDLSTSQNLAVYSSKPGTITVFNGTTSQTFNGGSVTLHGASVATGLTQVHTQGLQTVKLANGDVSIALKPGASVPSKPVVPQPTALDPGKTLKDNLKTTGKGVAAGVVVGVGVPVYVAGGVLVETASVVGGALTGHPIREAKETGKDLVQGLEDSFKWVGGWF